MKKCWQKRRGNLFSGFSFFFFLRLVSVYCASSRERGGWEGWEGTMFHAASNYGYNHGKAASPLEKQQNYVSVETPRLYLSSLKTAIPTDKKNNGDLSTSWGEVQGRRRVWRRDSVQTGFISISALLICWWLRGMNPVTTGGVVPPGR